MRTNHKRCSSGRVKWRERRHRGLGHRLENLIHRDAIHESRLRLVLVVKLIGRRDVLEHDGIGGAFVALVGAYKTGIGGSVKSNTGTVEADGHVEGRRVIGAD